MLSQGDMISVLLRSRAYRAQLVREDAVKEYGGDLGVRYQKPTILKHMINALDFCIAVQDYSSEDAQAVYDNLLRCIGNNFANGVTTDPQAQPPGGGVVIIINQGGGSGTTVASGKIPFTGATHFVVTNYQGIYKATYGNNPVLAVYIVNPATGIGIVEDTATVPAITYVGDVVANGIDTITLDYPIATTGFIQIMGITP